MKSSYRQFIAFKLCFFITFQMFSQMAAVGEMIPDYVAGNVLNHTSSTISLKKEFKGKMLIVEFWNHACINCIKAFGKIDSIQKKYKDQIQIILVNKESRDSTLKFFQMRKRIKPPSVPMITSDSVLIQIFPHKYYPYNVWIDRNRIIRYCSSEAELNNHSVAEFIRGAKLEIIDVNKEIHFGPVITEGKPDTSDRLLYYSYISRCRRDINVGNASLLKDGKGVKLSMNCGSIVDLLKKAYSDHYKYSYNTKDAIVLKVRDERRYLKPASAEEYAKWKTENCYSYDLFVPRRKAAIAYDIMKEDLTRYFDLEVSRERRLVRSLVLLRTDSLDRIQSKGGKPFNDFYFSNLFHPSVDSFRYLKNIPFLSFTNNLKSNLPYYTGLPFFDETGYRGNIDMEIKESILNPFNLNLFREELKRYGLALEERKREIDILVITER